MNQVRTNLIEVGDWIFEANRCRLKPKTVSGGETSDSETKLEPLTCDLLTYLIANPGQVIKREALIEHVWQGRVVSDDAVRRAIKKLRSLLKDDAKNPVYIRTHPLQGYSFIANVKVKTETREKPYPKIGIAAILLLILSLVIVYYQTIPTKLEMPEASLGAILNETKLTQLTGSEMQGNYHAASNRLIFTLRDNHTRSLQLLVKDLTTNLVSKISWQPGNYYQGSFSPSGKKVAYVHLKPGEEYRHIYIAEYDPQRGLLNPVRLEANTHSEWLLSWSSDGESLYYSAESEHDQPLEVYRYRLATQTNNQISYSTKQGMGAYYAKESPDGRQLAIMNNGFGRRFSLTILDLKTSEVIRERKLKFFASQIVWLENTARIQEKNGTLADLALGSFKGDLFYFAIEDNKLWEQPGTTPGLNDIFYSCGKRCFYMRRHTMNYADILELANPFSDPVPQTTWHLESNQAEFTPTYNHSGDTVFYVTKNESTAQIMKYKKGQTPLSLYTFSPRHIVRELVLSPNEKLIAGRLEDRLFTLEISTLTFKYIGSDLEKIGPPSWTQNNQELFFSRLKEDGGDLYAYRLSDKHYRFVTKDIVYFVEQADGRIFLINKDLQLQQQLADGRRLDLKKLNHLSSKNWQVQHNTLYYTDFDNSDTYLYKQDLLSGKVESSLLAKNSFAWEFMMHPGGEKLIYQRDQTAASDLVKVQWAP